MIEGSSIADIAHQNVEPPEPRDRGGDNLSALIVLRDVGDQRENPGFAAALPDLCCDGFDLGALARRRRDDMDSSVRKSQDHCPAEPAASAGHDGNAAWDLAALHIGLHWLTSLPGTYGSIVTITEGSVR
jgi:hypothetical protein